MHVHCQRKKTCVLILGADTQKKRQHNCWIWGEIERRNGQFFWYSNRKIVVGVPSPLQVVYGGSKAEPLGEAACRNSENKRRQASVLILTEHGIHEGETQTYTLRIAETVVHHTIHVTKWWTWGPANLLGKNVFHLAAGFPAVTGPDVRSIRPRKK